MFEKSCPPHRDRFMYTNKQEQPHLQTYFQNKQEQAGTNIKQQKRDPITRGGRLWVDDVGDLTLGQRSVCENY